MAKRNILRNQLRIAWKKTISDAYENVLINSERGLQVYFCKNLLDIFDGKGAAKEEQRESYSALERRIFVEPRVLVSGEGVEEKFRIPDVLICNSRHVIGVVELKYKPRGIPDYEKDFETLAAFANINDSITISNDRVRGVGNKPKNYPIANDAVLCWAAVHTDKEFNLEPNVITNFKDRLLIMRTISGKASVRNEFHPPESVTIF